jgi:acetyltransferase-like isoleucine patch superfamily enzyme
MKTLLEEIRELIFSLMNKKKKEYNRFLSIPDYFVDRWERAKMMGFGEGTSVYDSCLVLGDVTVGKNVWIGPYTILDGSGGLTIGDNCQIGAGVQIYTHRAMEQVLYNEEIKTEPVVIGHNVSIGPNVVITMGCHIGDWVAIGVNSVVSKDIPSKSMVLGNPARIIDTIKPYKEQI